MFGAIKLFCALIIVGVSFASGEEKAEYFDGICKMFLVLN